MEVGPLYLLEDGLEYWVTAREVLPFENELGLVRPSGWNANNSL
jgi:hypothetical protein